MLKYQYGQALCFSEYCWEDLLFTTCARAALPPAAPPSLPAASRRVVVSCWEQSPICLCLPCDMRKVAFGREDHTQVLRQGFSLYETCLKSPLPGPVRSFSWAHYLPENLHVGSALSWIPPPTLLLTQKIMGCTADGTLLFQLTFLKSSPWGPEPAGLGKDSDPLLTHKALLHKDSQYETWPNTVPSIRVARCYMLKAENKYVTFKWRTARYSSWHGHTAANGAGMAPNLPDTRWNWDHGEGRTCRGKPASWH